MQNYLNGRTNHKEIDFGSKQLIHNFSYTGNNPVSSSLINDGTMTGYWKLDGNYKDSTSNAADGELIGTQPFFTTDAINGQAMHFNGTSNFVNISHYEGIDVGANENFTLSVWVKTTQPPTSLYWPQIVKHEYTIGTRQGYDIVLHDSNSDSRWYGIIYSAGTGHTVWGNNDIADGRWHHLVLIRNGSNIISYEDGEYANTKAASSGSLSVNGDFRIGGSDGAWADYIGSIDEVGFWKRALNSDEIKNLYESSKIYFQIQSSDDNYTYTTITGNKPIPYAYEENKTLIKLPLNQNLKGYDNEMPIKNSIYNKEGLVGYWNFDDNTKDLSGNKNDIQIWNSTTLKETSLGQSLYFDTIENQDAVIVPNDEIWDIDKNMSISFFIWFKKETDCNSPDADKTNEVILNRFGGPSYGSWWFGCWGATDKLHLEVAAGSDEDLDSPQIIDDGIWHLGGWTLDGVTKNLSLYLDGVIVNSTIISDFSLGLKSNTPLCVGSYNYDPTNGYFCGTYEYNGYLDELSIWKRALTEKEAYALYTETAHKYGKFLSGKEITGATNLIYPIGNSIDENTVINCKFENGVLCDTGQKGEIITDYENIDGLVSYWPMDGNSNDLIGNNNGVDNSISYMKNSYSGTSANFDGTNDHIIVAADSTLDFDANHGYSFFMWVKNNGICDSEEFNTNEVFASREGAISENDWWLGCNGPLSTHPSQALRIKFEGGYGLDTENDNFLMNDTNWHQIGWTYNENTKTLSLYMDGEFVNSSTNTSFDGNWTSSADLCIGGYGNGTCEYYDANANIDDVMAFNKSLSATEIANLYTKTQGKYGEAFKSDGYHYIKLDNSNELNLGLEDFTVSMWVKPRELITTQGLLGKRKASESQYLFSIYNGKVMMYLDDGLDSVTLTSTSSLSLNQWNHFAYTIDRTSSLAKVYFNGEYEKSVDISSIGNLNNDEILEIGSGNAVVINSGHKKLNGSLDEVKIVKRVLSEQEIYNEYQGNLKANKGTISFMLKPNWNGNDNTAHTFFDEGNIKMYKDSSNNFNFEILGNKASFNMNTITTDTWYRIDGTWNSSSIDVYLDGTHKGSTTMPSSTINLNSYMFIGNSIEQDESCNCTIDDFNIFNYDKAASQLNPTGFSNMQNNELNISTRFLKITSIFETNSPLISPSVSYFTINSSLGIQYTSPTPLNNSNINTQNINFNATFSYTDITACNLNIDGSSYAMDLNSNYCNYTWTIPNAPISSYKYNITYVKSTTTYSLENRTINTYPDLTQEQVPFANILTYLIALCLIIGGIIKK